MKKKNIFLFILFSSILMGQNGLVTNFDKQINRYLFNGDWSTADSLIETKLLQNPNSLKYNFFKAYNSFYTRYLGNDNPYSREETIRQVKKYSWDAIETGESMEGSIENYFYLGSSYAYLSRVNVMNGEFWEGYWNASKAEDYFEEVIELDPSISDAYLNLGVNEYFPAISITGFQSVLAWFGGMSGDRELGIKYITKVSETGNLFRDEAKYILGLMYNFRENDIINAHNFWNSLHNTYPRNNNFLVQKNRSYFAKLVDERGVDFLNDEFEQLDSLYNINNPGILNILGYNLMNQNRLDEALVVFKTNVKKYPDVANGYDSLAECYMTRGETENAIKFYKIAFEKLKTDSTINDNFRQLLEDGIKNNLEELGSSIDV